MNFDDLIPNKVLIDFKEIDELGIISRPMLNKLKAASKIKITKIGQKNFVAKKELVRYLESNTY